MVARSQGNHGALMRGAPYDAAISMKLLRVGIDSYSLGPLRLGPLALLDWAKAHGADGVHFSDGWVESGHSLSARARHKN